MEQNTNLKIVDSHQHFWQFDPAKHPWISREMEVLRTDFMPEELYGEMVKWGVTSTVAVQANQSEEETLFLLDLAEKHDFISGVVGWIDLQNSDLAQRLTYFSNFEKLKGFRHLVQDEPGDEFLVSASFTRGISLLGNYNYTYDILIYPKQLKAALKLVEMFPHQKFVIDHMAKPLIKEGLYREWALLMKNMGQFRNVWCKVSGLITEAHWGRWQYEDMEKYLTLVFESFDNDRIMFGSDWPVCLLAGSYQQVIGLLEFHLKHLDPAIQQKVWSGNASEFYGL